MYKIFFFLHSKSKGLRWKFWFGFYRSYYNGRVFVPSNIEGESPDFLLDNSSSSIRLGERVAFRGKSFFLAYEGGKIEVGDHVFFNRGCSVNCLSGVTIGSYCLFGERVSIWDHNHNIVDKNLPIKDQGYTKVDINIGNNCWLGANVVILKGVTLGERVVVAAGSVVTKNIPSFETWGGVPATKL